MHKFIRLDYMPNMIFWLPCFCLKWNVEFVGQNFVLGKRCMLIFNACLMFLCLPRSRDAILAVLVVICFCFPDLFFIVVAILT